LKITKIETYRLDYKTSHFHTDRPLAFQASYGTYTGSQHVIVKIHTDRGITGIGEAANSVISAPGRTHLRPKETSDTVIHMIRDFIAPNIVGDDPLEIGKIHYKMDAWICGHKSAKAAVDMALYDIMGHSYETPICKLLGGCYRKDIPCLAAIGIEEPEEMAKEALSWVEKGWIGFQMKIGGLAVKPEKDVERVRQVRDAVGDEIIILADANQAYSPRTAIRTIKKMERYDIYAEQPTPAYDIKALARVAEAVEVPILADESLTWGGEPIHNLVEIVQNNAADMLKLKNEPVGGIYKQMKIVRMAEEFELPCVTDCDQPMTRILGTALAHVAAALDYRIFFPSLAASGFMTQRPDIVKSGGVQLEKNILKLPEGSGLGIEIKEEMLSK